MLRQLRAWVDTYFKMPQGDIHARGHTLASPRTVRASFPDNKFKVQLIIYVSLISPPFPYRRDEPLGRIPGLGLLDPVSAGPLHSAGAPLHPPPPHLAKMSTDCARVPWGGRIESPAVRAFPHTPWGVGVGLGVLAAPNPPCGGAILQVPK
jgi:hypothetical protein